MKTIFNSICVFTLIYGIDSSIRVERTIPHETPENIKFFPALLLRRNAILKNDPAVPNDMVVKDGISRFKFEMFDVRFEPFNNLSVSFVCPKESNPMEVESSNSTECKNQLQVTTSMTEDYCGGKDDDRKIYYIGYGEEKELCLLPCTSKPGSETNKQVEYILYKSCFDEEGMLVYHVKYILRRKNNLYHRPQEIYPEALQQDITQLELDYRKEMAQKFGILHVLLFNEGGPWDPVESLLIPFQLVSHEDMVLYNWKLATFHEKNYSLIWSNIAQNAWKRLNLFLRNLMKTSNCNLTVYSGVHEYSQDGYPRYIWKFVRSYMKGVAIVIHNHRRGDPERYPLLCEDDNDSVVNCERYGFYSNEKDENRGYTYCCTTKKLGKKIPFFKNRFTEIQPLETGHLCDKPIPWSIYDRPEESNLLSSHVLKRLDSSLEAEPSQKMDEVEEESHVLKRLNSSSEAEPSQKTDEVEEESGPVKKTLKLSASMEASVGSLKANLLSVNADPTFFERKGLKQIGNQ